MDAAQLLTTIHAMQRIYHEGGLKAKRVELCPNSTYPPRERWALDVAAYNEAEPKCFVQVLSLFSLTKLDLLLGDLEVGRCLKQ